MNSPMVIALLSIHGLIRGHDLELGRDADTGGQTKYVVELARALGARAEVGKVLLFTRRIVDAQVSDDYAQPLEILSEKAAIVRLECGEPGYLRKELLWDSLDNFADNLLDYLKTLADMPDVLHSHYADAGYVGARLSHQLGIPLVHTGHSLGHNKRKQLLASGVSPAEIEAVYHISRRIEAEEQTLAAAERVITSTQQEIEQQYGLYDFYQPERMCVIPPGTDLQKFSPATGEEVHSDIAQMLPRFLSDTSKPIILALSRPDPRKNIIKLIEAYASSPRLQTIANLVIVAGNRENILDMEQTSKNTLNDILLAIDRHDLYGKVAYPKHHKSEEVAVLYRLTALSRGVFVNPALTEPFGLTLIEAAACGVPIVATEDGGPQDIIKNCKNGYLINPLDKKSIAHTLLKILSQPRNWQRFAINGVKHVVQYYSWQAHVENYLRVIQPLVAQQAPIVRIALPRRTSLFRDSALFASLDLNILGDDTALAQLVELMVRQRKKLMLGIATGRGLNDALSILRQYNIPKPDILITEQGSEIYYTSTLTEDTAWARHINFSWAPEAIQKILCDIPGLAPQHQEQRPFKLSYFMDTRKISLMEVKQLLLRHEQAANAIYCFGQYLDILPMRASKGLALRWCAQQFGLPLENILACGVTGADADMLRGNTLAAVVNNRHMSELAELVNIKDVYFTQQAHAAGILEAVAHFNLLGKA